MGKIGRPTKQDHGTEVLTGLGTLTLMSMDDASTWTEFSERLRRSLGVFTTSESPSVLAAWIQSEIGVKKHGHT